MNLKMNEDMKLKAVQMATGSTDLELINRLDEYILDPTIRTPEDAARAELHVSMDDREAELLIPLVDLYGYGLMLIKHYNSVLTPYGLVERRDGKPLRTECDHSER